MKSLLIFTILACFVFSFSVPVFTYAQTSGGPPKNTGVNSGKLQNPLSAQGVNTIEDLIPKILEIVVQIGVVVCTFFIIFAGFMYVTAAGDETKIKKAHSIFLYSVIGTIVLLGAQIISSVLGNTVKNVLGK
jgi:hypothetical protein